MIETNIETHAAMLVCRIQRAVSIGHLLRGTRRSREVARKHGVSWPLVRDLAYGRIRRERYRSSLLVSAEKEVAA